MSIYHVSQLSTQMCRDSFRGGSQQRDNIRMVPSLCGSVSASEQDINQFSTVNSNMVFSDGHHCWYGKLSRPRRRCGESMRKLRNGVVNKNENDVRQEPWWMIRAAVAT